MRCRKGSLEYNQYPIPVFSPLDQIVEIHDGVLGDVNFVAKPQRKVSACLELCYTPGWNHRCMVEFLLHHGIVSWADVTHRITATAHYPADTLAKPLQVMEQAWKDAGHGDLAKRSVNSLIGLWCLDESFSYKCLSSTREDDCPPGALKSTFHYGSSAIFDFIVKEQISNGGISNRPLHDLAMGQEHVRLGTAMYALKRLRNPVLELKTDSILYRAPKRAKLNVASLTYENVHSTRDLFEGRAQRLNQGCTLPPWQGTGPVFRVQTASQDDFLKCNPKKPARPHDLSLTTETWRELSMEDAEHRVLASQSILRQDLYVPGLGRAAPSSGQEGRRDKQDPFGILTSWRVHSGSLGSPTCDPWSMQRRRALD